MFIVRFVRRDRHPNEEYYYNTIEEARWHLNLFHEDDSGLYERVVLIDMNHSEVPIDVIEF